MSKPIGGKALTAELTRLGKLAHTVLNDGTPVTKDEVLAELIWSQALGWTEETLDDEGNKQKIVHKPVAWAQQYIIERREGRAPQSVPDQAEGIRAADKVRKLAQDRINTLARKTAGVLVGPPAYKPKTDHG